MNYVNGKIYKLISDLTSEIYIGSTIQLLTQRKSKHLHKFNKGILKCSSKKIFEAGNVEIVLIEEYPCKSKKELEARERYWIETTENCVNKTVPTRTQEQYYSENKEKIKARAKSHYQKNKEEVLKRRKEYRDTHKDEIKAYMKAYYDKHKADF